MVDIMVSMPSRRAIDVLTGAAELELDAAARGATTTLDDANAGRGVSGCIDARGSTSRSDGIGTERDGAGTANTLGAGGAGGRTPIDERGADARGAGADSESAKS
jgi:hypothetical protein